MTDSSDPSDRPSRTPDPGSSAEQRPTAQRHYGRGNRLYEAKAWELARLEWRNAAQLWHPVREAGRELRNRLAGLRAVVALLATVIAIYYVIFTFFPRDPFELLMAGIGFQDSRSWWEEFLDSGRPGAGDGHKMGIREWWDRFSDRFSWGGEDRLAQRERFRPSIDERWADLLRRYGRWGPLVWTDLDFHIVAGYGLTTLGDFERAVEILQEGIATTSDELRLGELYQALATTYYFQGYQLQKDRLATYDLELVRLSAEAYEKSIRYSPQILSYGNLGWAYFLLGDYRRAEHNSLRALSYDETLEYVRLNLGLIHLVQDRHRRAFAAYRHVALQRPAGDVYLGGINDLRELLRDNPGRYSFAHLIIGYLNLHKGDLPETRRHLREYLNRSDAGDPWRQLAQQWLVSPVSALEY